MIRKKNREELLNEILRGIVQETDITMVGKGSVTRGLASVFSSTVEEIYQILDDAVTNSFLPTAKGFYLDLFGESFGLPRRLPTPSVVSASDRIIRFSVRSGTLADVLPHPSNLNLGRVPVGTVVSTDTGVSFTVDANYDFPAAAKIAFVGATSADSGSSQNVGVGTVVNIDNLAATGLSVTNVGAITTGSDVESDQEYRFRISRWVRTSAGRNEVAVRLAVFAAPGVADMIKEPYFAGPGSFRIVVIPSGNRVTAEAMKQIYSNLRNVVSEGTFFLVERPRYLPISLGVRLIPAEGSSISATDRDLAKRAILNYLGDIRPGDTMIINAMRAAVLGASRNIADLRIQGISINRRPQALINYTLEDDELFVPDDELDEPILVI